MKREGRQRGMVRTHPILPAPFNPRPNTRNLNLLSSPPTAGKFTRVAGKPTNHSKFTGKCGRPRCRDCHCRPASKSRDKIKGAHKIRSSSEDAVVDYRVITWKVVESVDSGSKISGFSATGALDYLGRDGYADRDCYYDGDDCGDYDDGCCDYGLSSSNVGVEIEEVDDDGGGGGGGDEDGMSFCEVGFVLEEGDESWCFVEEM